MGKEKQSQTMANQWEARTEPFELSVPAMLEERDSLDFSGRNRRPLLSVSMGFLLSVRKGGFEGSIKPEACQPTHRLSIYTQYYGCYYPNRSQGHSSWLSSHWTTGIQKAGPLNEHRYLSWMEMILEYFVAHFSKISWGIPNVSLGQHRTIKI